MDLTPNNVANQLVELARDLENLTRSLEYLEHEAVNRREDFTLALAKAFLASEGAMELRKNRAIVATSTERLAAETAEALVRGRKRQLDSLRIRIDIGRTLAATLRVEAAL